MKLMQSICLVGICLLWSLGQGSVVHGQESSSPGPGKWEVAGKEVKEATSAVADATRDSASSTWKGIKKGSSKAWKKTKAGSKEIYDTVGEKSKEAWHATKEESQELWQKGKSALHGDTGPAENKKPAAAGAVEPDEPIAPEPPQVREPEI